MNKLQLIWVDDSSERREAAIALGENLEVAVDFICLENKNVSKELSLILEGNEPDLILMDHSLDRADYESIRSGSSAAAIIRDKWPSCPIISVTGIEPHDMDSRHRSAYEEIFQAEQISQNYDKIHSIATGFRLMKEQPPKKVIDLLDYLKTPEQEGKKIIKIFPHELKDQFDDKSLLLEFYRWCQSILFQRPGFLINRLWVSTLLGLTEEGFKEVEFKFKSALYMGVFSNSSQIRWWKSEVLSILAEETGKVGLPWMIGRELLKEQPGYFSKCYSSHEDYPETVAAVDEMLDTEWYPMKLKYTETHPLFEEMLFFEELRIMKAEE